MELLLGAGALVDKASRKSRRAPEGITPLRAAEEEGHEACPSISARIITKTKKERRIDEQINKMLMKFWTNF